MSGKEVKAPPGKSFQKASAQSALKEQEDLVRLLFFAFRLAENMKAAELESGEDPNTDEAVAKQSSFFDDLVESLFPDYKKHPERMSADAKQGLDDFFYASRRRYTSSAERDAHLGETTHHYATLYQGKYPHQPIVKDHLLNLIAGAESGGSYNIAYGGKRYDLENMTVHEVRALQRSIVSAGGPSSAMGRYQIMGYTMDDLIKQMHLTGNERFDKNMQDSMAIRLADRRGLTAFLEGRIDATRFANRLTDEWAGIKNSTGRGAYDGDGLNRGSLSHRTLADSLDNMRSAVRTAESVQSKPPGSGGPAVGV